MRHANISEKVICGNYTYFCNPRCLILALPKLEFVHLKNRVRRAKLNN